MKYNKDQWISSFEDAMVKARPHLPARVLTSMALMAWTRHGTKDEDPQGAALEWLRAARPGVTSAPSSAPAARARRR